MKSILKKNLISLSVVLINILFFAAFNVVKAVTIDNLVYTLNSTTYTATLTGRVTCPTSINVETVSYNSNTYTVTAVGANAITDCNTLVSINLPKVVTLGESAFNRSTSLTTVNLPEITTLGNYVFNGCTSLTTVSLPKITTFGNSAFSGCTALTSVSFPETTTFGYDAFNNCTSLTSVSLPKVTTFGNSAFSGCASLASISLPEVTVFGSAAFRYCTGLTTVSLPKVTTFGSYAFSGCTSLTSISLPEATTFGDSAFNNCTTLTSVSLPKVTTFGAYNFESCAALTSVDLPEVTTFGNENFRFCSALTSISLPKVVTFGKNAFLGCTKLSAVDFPEATTFGDGAFSSCSALTSVNLPKATTFGEYAFLNDSALKNIYFPKVTTFANHAFDGCWRLVNVNLPEATTFGNYAFYGCSALRFVQLPKLNSADYSFLSSGNILNSILLGHLPSSVSDIISSSNYGWSYRNVPKNLYTAYPSEYTNPWKSLVVNDISALYAAPIVNSVSATTTSTSAIINLKTNKPVQSRVRYNLISDNLNLTSNLTAVLSAENNMTLSSLLSCTTYFYQPAIIDVIDQEATGEVAMFTTKGCDVDASISAQTTSKKTNLSGGSLSLSDSENQIQLDVPANLKTGLGDEAEIFFQVRSLITGQVLDAIDAPNDAENNQLINSIYDLKAYSGNGTKLSEFDSPIMISLSYTDEQVAGLNLSTLAIYRYDDGVWTKLETTVDQVNKKLIAYTNHFSLFASFGEEKTTSGGNDNSNSNSTNSSSTNTTASSNNEPTVCTDTKPASIPDLFQITTTKNAAKIYFSPLAETNKYFVSFSSTNKSAEEFGEEIELTREGVQSHTIYYLKPNTVYYLKIRGQKGCATGEWSNIMQFKTNGWTYYRYSPIAKLVSLTKKTTMKKSESETKKVLSNSSLEHDQTSKQVITEVNQPAKTSSNETQAPKTAAQTKKKCLLWWCW